MTEEQLAKQREYYREYYARNKERIRKRVREWYRADPNKAKKYRAAAKKRDPEKFRAMKRKTAGLPEPTRPTPEACECCGGPPRGKGSTFHLDHCHETGKFRGWLCSMCNTAIGKLGDNVDGLMRAVDYLKRAA